jgi:hypothetical protein
LDIFEVLALAKRMNFSLGELKEISSKITIISMRGEILRELIFSKAQAEINIEDLASGVYFVRMEVGEEVIVKKVVVE